MQHFGEADYEIEKAIAAHHGRPYIAKNCECWEGYKRVPGTKPCAPGSCEKCDSHSKESATKIANEESQRLIALWDQAVELVKTQEPYQKTIDYLAKQNGIGPDPDGFSAPARIEAQIFKHPLIEDEIMFGALGEFGFRDLTPEIIADKINKELYRQFNDYTLNYFGSVTASQNNEWEQAKDIIVQRYPDQADPMGGGSQAIEVAKHHLDQIFEEAAKVADQLGGPTVENFVTAIEQVYNLGGRTSKIASQGDKPSPHAAQAVLMALESGDEEGAKELLKKTDCPEGCETHPEGKCNHQYMSAGRTRVRYLINDSSFDKDPDEKDFGTTEHEASVKEAIFGSGIARRLIKMIAGGACPVCEGKGTLKKVRCKACDGTGSADKIINFGKRKWGELTEGNLPEAVDIFRNDMGFSSLEDDEDFGSFDDDIDEFDSLDDEFDSFDDDDELGKLLREEPLSAPKEKPKLLDRFRKKDTTPEVNPVSDPEDLDDLWGDDEFDNIDLDSYETPDEVDQLLAPTPVAQPQQQQNQGIWDKTKQYFQGQPQQQQQQQQQNAPYGVCGSCNTPYQDALQDCKNPDCSWNSDNW